MSRAARQPKSRQLRKGTSSKKGNEMHHTLHGSDMLRVRTEPPVPNKGEDVNGRSNRLSLKRLRNRAGVTAAQAAQACGIGESGYMRYEDARRFDKEPIPANVIMGVIPILVGKGEPPVRMEELLEISEIANIQNVLGSGVFKPVAAAPIGEMAEWLPGLPNLRIKYRLERGTYRVISRLQATNYGCTPILPLRTYAQEHQWAAVVHDDHGKLLGLPAGTIVHCVDIVALSQNSMPAGSVVVALSHKGDELGEVCLGVVTGYERRGPVVAIRDADTDDGALSGVGTTEVLGAAVYRYGPVAQQSV